MKVFQRKLLLYGLAAGTALMSACTSPGYNDNPSQQITNARVGCAAATDFFAVYFSMHVQPPDENPNAKLTKERFRSYCNDIPTPGKVFFTTDLVGRELRKIPIGILIVEQESGDAESPTGYQKHLHTLSEVPPKTYTKGVIESSFELNKSGHYAIYLMRGGEDAVSEEDKLRIPLNVGVDSGEKLLMKRIIITFGAAWGLALIGVAAFRYLRRRKTV